MTEDFVPFETLGRRICIFGPSSVGKSTLAVAIARRIGVEAVHLDRFRHYPDTDWQARPDAEMEALHDAAILANAWVMDGNYTQLVPRRVARATGLIVLDAGHWARLGRYLRRTLFERKRFGALHGGRDSMKLEMLDWVFFKTRASGARTLASLTGTTLPLVHCPNGKALKRLYRAWGLERPAQIGNSPHSSKRSE